LYAGGQTIGAILEDNAVTNVQALHVLFHLDHFSDDLVAWIGVIVAGQGGGGNVEVSVNKDQGQVTTADTGQRITNTHPVGCR